MLHNFTFLFFAVYAKATGKNFIPTALGKSGAFANPPLCFITPHS